GWDFDGANRVVGDAENAGEVVAAPPGDDPERRLGSGHGAANRTDQAVATADNRYLAGIDRAQRSLYTVLEAVGPLCPKRDSSRIELLLDLRQQLQGAPVSGVRIYQQGQWHSLDGHLARTLDGLASQSRSSSRAM